MELSQAFPNNPSVVIQLAAKGITTTEQALERLHEVELTRGVGKVFLTRLAQLTTSEIKPKSSIALFVQNRRTHRSHSTVVKSADCELRLYPHGVGTNAQCNTIAIQVIDRRGVKHEEELIYIKFANGSAWSGTFEKLHSFLMSPDYPNK